ncbi:5-dehydro-4-deoxy-D-glucuronate isomerase [Actinoallomurus acanthiterrae]
MEIRHGTHPDQVAGFGTEDLRRHYLVEDLFPSDAVRTVYSHSDRIVVGGVRPAPDAPVRLEAEPPLRAEYFCERREIGVVNVGAAAGTVEVDGTAHPLNPREVLYVGRGSRDVVFSAGDDPGAAFYLVSTPAHATHPTAKATVADAAPNTLGGIEGSNHRTIYRYIHADGVKSCQLVLGITVLEPGSMWNTMPCHVHDRRTEVYLYFGLEEGQRIFHVLGRPDETRHIVMANEQAVISPPWSVHCGFGTQNYSFVWAMGGENQAYGDMDPVAIEDMR